MKSREQGDARRMAVKLEYSKPICQLRYERIGKGTNVFAADPVEQARIQASTTIERETSRAEPRRGRKDSEVKRRTEKPSISNLGFRVGESDAVKVGMRVASPDLILHKVGRRTESDPA